MINKWTEIILEKVKKPAGIIKIIIKIQVVFL